MFRWLVGLLLIVSLLAAAGAYVVAGRGAPPPVTINKPDRVVGQAGTVDVTADAPNAQAARRSRSRSNRTAACLPLFTLDGAQTRDASRDVGRATSFACRARSASRACPNCNPAPRASS